MMNRTLTRLNADSYALWDLPWIDWLSFIGIDFGLESLLRIVVVRSQLWPLLVRISWHGCLGVGQMSWSWHFLRSHTQAEHNSIQLIVCVIGVSGLNLSRLSNQSQYRRRRCSDFVAAGFFALEKNWNQCSNFFQLSKRLQLLQLKLKWTFLEDFFLTTSQSPLAVTELKSCLKIYLRVTLWLLFPSDFF